jgi:hypothetical protein
MGRSTVSGWPLWGGLGARGSLTCPPIPLPATPLPPRAAWDRQVYIYDADGQGGQPTIYKRNDTIDHNWILANYHSSMAIDNGT